MNSAIKVVIALIVSIGILGGLFFLIGKSRAIPDNPPNTAGNTAGNLYNQGLFCEDDGKVYFSNPYDSGALYVMNPDESEIKKLAKYSTKWINAAGDYLYFYQAADGSSAIAGFGGHMMGVYRSRKNGEEIKCLDKTPSGTVALAGNNLYYEHYTNSKSEGMTLYKVSTDKKEKVQILKEIADPSCVVNGGIYLAKSSGDHTLYYLDTKTDSIIDIFHDTVFSPIVLSDGDTVYYMNVMDNYKLYKASISSGEKMQISVGRIDCFNVTDSYIYYQHNGDDAALMRCRLDGSETEVVADGVYNCINATSRYLYFKPFGSDTVMLRTPVNGPVSVSDFSNARAAVTN